MSSEMIKGSITQIKEIAAEELEPGMALGMDMKNSAGAVVMPKGTVLEAKHVEALKKANVKKLSIAVEVKEEAAAPAAAAPAASGDRIRVLIVDDAKFMRMTLRKILEAEQYEVVGEAENGAEGVQLAQSLKPTVITMDITMPVMDGISAVKNIKKVYPEAKVIMISALGQTEKIKESIVAGAADFIVKPFNPEKVKKSMNTVLAR